MTKKTTARHTTRRETRSITLGPRAALLIVLGAAALAGSFWIASRPDTPTGGGVGDITSGDVAGRTAQPVSPGAVPGLAAGGGVTPEGDPFIGSANAPVTVVEYSDFQCPNCRQFATEVMPWLEGTWLGRGFVRVVYRDFAIRGEASFRAAEAAHCAGEAGRFWEYHDALFEGRGYAEGEAFAQKQLLAIGDSLGLDMPALSACIGSGRHRARVQTSTDAALARGYEGTPTYEINGRVTAGAIPIESWNELFRAYEVDMGG